MKRDRQHVVFGSRGSKLALAQTRHLMQLFSERYPQIACDLKIIATTGDRVQDIPLSAMASPGVFVREIEQALQSGEINVAVHSFKDLPTKQPADLLVAAVPERADVRDALYARRDDGSVLQKTGAVVGTSSVRRQAQLLALNPSLTVQDIRGNVDTRMRKVDDGDYDATILAAAGLTRLGLAHRITRYFSLDEMLPAPAQGALAIEIAAGDETLRALIAGLDNRDAHATALAERAVLEALGSGCSLPLAAHAVARDNKLFLQALVIDVAGEERLVAHGVGTIDAPRKLGERVAAKLRRLGAERILQHLESDVATS